MTEFAFEGGTRSSTTIEWSFATQNLANDVNNPFSGFVGALYQSTVQAAFARWASVSGLIFTQVPDGADVPIRVGFEAFTKSGELGETDFRYVRGALGNDTLVRLLDPATSTLLPDASGLYAYQYYGVTLFQVTLHEIGHALGLDHTTDPATIMYPYASSNNPDLAAGDIQGIATLYPIYDVVANDPVQAEGTAGQRETFSFTITRYGDLALPLTLRYAVNGVAYPGLSGSVGAGPAEFGARYPSGLITFAAGSNTATLGVSVVGAASAQPDDGFAITLSTITGGNVTVRGQVNALILDDKGYGQFSSSGALGIYRFFDTANGTHFYSASETERNTLIKTRPDLVYEGVELTAVGSPATDAAALPVYRFFDVKEGTHFYSISSQERDTILATRPDLTFEGTAFYEHGIAQKGDTPVYRFFDLVDGTHFYTTSATERASILATRPDLHDEGIGFYAPGA